MYASQLALPKNDMYINPVGSMRRDAFPEDGSVPGSDPGLMVRQLLDGCGVDRAVLIGGNMFGLGALADPDAAAAIATAYNTWLARGLARPRPALSRRARGRPAGPAARRRGDRPGMADRARHRPGVPAAA